MERSSATAQYRRESHKILNKWSSSWAYIRTGLRKSSSVFGRYERTKVGTQFRHDSQVIKLYSWRGKWHSITFYDSLFGVYLSIFHHCFMVIYHHSDIPEKAVHYHIRIWVGDFYLSRRPA
jgi:hypothetical protein